MASAFSAPDAAVITHQPQLDESLLQSTSAQSGRPVEELYDVQSTAARIVQGGFQRVALQFPDEGLPDSVPIYWALKRAFAALSSANAAGQPDLFVLADTSYGNCCVDEVAAQHVNADVVVHYGHACLSPTARLPVIYVFPKRPMDVDQTAGTLASSAVELFRTWSGEERKAFVLSYDVGYAYAAEALHEKIQHEISNLASTSTTKQLPPLIMCNLDTETNFEQKLRQQPPAVQEKQTSRSNGCGTCAVSTSNSRCNAAAKDSCACIPLPTSRATSDALLGNGDGSGRSYCLPPGTSLSDCIVLYVGGESLALTNLLLRTGPSCPVLAFDPYQPDIGIRRLDGTTNRLLMRRYAAVQKARDASVVGLLVGTLGVQSYLPLLADLREKLTGRQPGEKKRSAEDNDQEVNGAQGDGRRSRQKPYGGAGRKVYTISVGKLSPAKLANFQEVDIFVLLACPENSLVDAVDPTGLRSREFYKPIVTPYEMMLALDESRAWTGEYVLEMNRLVGTAGVEREADDGSSEEEDADRPHFSLVTGGYVSRKKFGGQLEDDDANNVDDAAERARADHGAVVVRGPDGQLTRVLESANAMHLSTRTWKGLETRLGMDAPSVLEEGRAGIARGYAEADGTREGPKERREDP